MAWCLSFVAVAFQIGLIVCSSIPPRTSSALVQQRLITVSGAHDYCPCRCCLLPHPDKCKGYYLCLENVLYQKECEDGELFNKVLENCDFEDRVHCPKPITPTPMVFHCKKREGLFPHPNDCGSFVQCSNWNPYTHRCPSSLHFSEELERCEYPSVAKCPYENHRHITEISAKAYRDGKCQERDGMFKYSRNSSLYLQCEDWSPRVRFCPPDTRYNAKRWICTINKTVL